MRLSWPSRALTESRGVPVRTAVIRRLVVPLAVAFLGFAVPLVGILVVDARRQVVENVRDQAEIIALLAARTDPADFADQGGADVILQWAAGHDGEAAGVFDTNGEQVAGVTLPEGTVEAPVVRGLLDGPATGQIDPDLGLAIGVAPVKGPSGVTGMAVVTLPAGLISVPYVDMLGVVGVVVAGILVAGALVGRTFARGIVGPVRALDGMAQSLSAGELETRVEVGRAPRELRRLADNLNEVAAELSRLLSHERAFSANASHQLRTPLAALRLRLEALEMGGQGSNTLRSAIAEVDRLTGIVAGLLDQARSASGAKDAIVTDVATAAVTRVAAWQAMARGAHVDVRCPATVAYAWSIPGAFDQVLENLLSNAIRVAPRGSSVEVELSTEGSWVTVRVLDRGPGMGPVERVQAFERFWRAPDAAADGGTGLGLPIAADLVRASGGTLELLERDGGGLVAQVRLRAASPRLRANGGDLSLA